MDEAEALKYAAAARALEFVVPGMRLGLGSGSTSAAFVELLGTKVRDGLEVICTATSNDTAAKARPLGIALAPLADLTPLDLAVDGADEVDPQLNLIKGGGGALTREKIVETHAKRLIVIADERKWVQRLGRFPLPVEVVEFAHPATAALIAACAADLGYGEIPISLRMKGGDPYRTDNGNVLYDCRFEAIHDAAALAASLSAIPGVVEHGLFVGMADCLILARAGGVEVIHPIKEAAAPAGS